MKQVEELLNQEESRGRTQSPCGGIVISMAPTPNAMEVLLVGTHPIRPKDMETHQKRIALQEEAFK